MKKFQSDYHGVEDLIRRYEEAGGEVLQLDEGCLQIGDWVLYDPDNKLYCFYIYERYLNEWSSDQIICKYSAWDKFPKKYKKMIDKKLAEIEAEEEQ